MQALRDGGKKGKRGEKRKGEKKYNHILQFLYLNMAAREGKGVGGRRGVSQ